MKNLIMKEIMISIVCPVHNGLNYTKKCLASLSAAIDNSSFKNDISIILVDDGSTDGTSDWINESYPQIKVLKGDGDLWWSGAINLGVKYAIASGTKYVLLINNDNIFAEDFLDDMILSAIENNIKILGCKVHFLGSDEIWAMGGYFDTKSGQMGIYKDITQLRNNNKVGSHCYRVDWLPGMGTLIHRSVFEKIGYWDENNFPQYYGDSDFILRAKKNGIAAYVHLDSVLWNDTETTGIVHGGSFMKLIRSLITRKSYYDFRASFMFAIKHTDCYLTAVRFLVVKYVRYIGGFFKHRFIGACKGIWRGLNLIIR